VFQPGAGLDPALREDLMTMYRSDVAGLQARTEAGFGVNMFLNIVPRNPLDAAVKMDMLAVIFFAIVFGAGLAILPAERARPLIDLLEGLNGVMMKIIGFAMKLAPYGVFCLVFVVTARLGLDILERLAEYVAVVLAGLVIYGAVGLSLLVKIFSGISPAVFWRKAKASVVTAFSTSSSSATLPTNIAVAEQEFGIPPRVAGFVLPLGATMNMNGTSLYEGVTVLFLAQVFGIELSLGSQLIVLMLAIITSVGAAGVPGGSLPLLMTVLATVNVPPESIAIILGVDRILDMARTTLNVTGDLAAATFVARTEAGWVPPER
jgi:DAACS family dicarboxylate/amino acid:cation (Na+ or H+) symporter